MTISLYEKIISTLSKNIDIPAPVIKRILSSALKRIGKTQEEIEMQDIEEMIIKYAFVDFCIYLPLSTVKEKIKITLSEIGSSRTLTQKDILPLVFTPSKPVTISDLFRGRRNQVESLMSVLNQPGRHAILYGERGVGKTSMANFFRIIIGRNVAFAKVECTVEDSYQSLWTRIFENLMVRSDEISKKRKDRKSTLRIEGSIKLSTFIPDETKFSPSEIADWLSPLEREIVIIIDEFDRLGENFEKAKLADTVKLFSDKFPNIRFLIVGVADNVSKLIGHHESIERNIQQIPVNLMNKRELEEIVESGFMQLDMQISDEVKKKIAHFSCGYPYHVHSVCFYSCQIAIKSKQTSVNTKHFRDAITAVINDTQESLRSNYHTAITFRDKVKSKQLLSACAHVESDEYGLFQAKDLVRHMEKICGVSQKVQNFNALLNKLTSLERGEILICITKKKEKYFKLRNPLMKPFLLMLHEINIGI